MKFVYECYEVVEECKDLGIVMVDYIEQLWQKWRHDVEKEDKMRLAEAKKGGIATEEQIRGGHFFNPMGMLRRALTFEYKERKEQNKTNQ
jgi:hypothetical protein